MNLIGPDASVCQLGRITSHIGADLYTTDIKVRVIRDGLTTTYVCTFHDVPDVIVPEDPFFGVWVRPSEAYVDDVPCWRPEFQGREDGAGLLVIPPKGPVTVTCHFIER